MQRAWYPSKFRNFQLKLPLNLRFDYQSTILKFNTVAWHSHGFTYKSFKNNMYLIHKPSNKINLFFNFFKMPV
jgi:hypothetical protein